MTKWYVKDVSKLTGVSIQTLHYYDRQGLLKPSARLASGYRLYSEKDLTKLQQIIALKFFGFTVAQIKKILEGYSNIKEHFALQAQFLEEKAEVLHKASQMLRNITSEFKDKNPPWQKIIKLIGIYNMSKKLEKNWVDQVFNHEELKQYAEFEIELDKRFTEKEKSEYEEAWDKLIKDIKANLYQAPQSEFGSSIAQQSMGLINNFYGKDYAHLKYSLWEKGFKKDKHPDNHRMSPEVVAWLNQAIDAYYWARGMEILQGIDTHPDNSKALWEELMEEMYGNSEELKQSLYKTLIADPKVTSPIKEWLKRLLS